MSADVQDSLCVECIRKGREEAVIFVEKVPELRCKLARDVRAHYDGDPRRRAWMRSCFVIRASTQYLSTGSHTNSLFVTYPLCRAL